MNSITFAIDGLQAGLLGPYGNTWVRTPEIDRLAAESFLCDQVLVSNPLTAARDLWIGRHALMPEASTLADTRKPADTRWFRLTQSGIATAVITDDPAFAQIVRTYVMEIIVVPTEHVSRTAKNLQQTQLFQLLDAGAEWLDGRAEPFALWIHSRGMLGPWDAPYELREQFADEEDPPPPDFVEPPLRRLPPDADPDELLGIRHAYAGQVALLDTCLGALLDQVRTSPSAAQTLFQLVGVRGYPLGEHGVLGFVEQALYREAVHVPWLLRCPTGLGAAARTNALLYPHDVAATLLEWHGIATNIAGNFASHSLWPQIRGSESESRDRLICVNDDGEFAVRTPCWHLRAASPTEGELYTHPDDWFEVNDVSGRCPGIVDDLREVLAVTQAAANDERANLAPLPPQLVEYRG